MAVAVAVILIINDVRNAADQFRKLIRKFALLELVILLIGRGVVLVNKS